MDFNLKVEKRAVAQKKSDNKNIRKEGYIPGIIYGDGKVGTLIKLRSNEFVKAYNKSLGELVFFNLEVEGKTYKTIIKDKQVHPSTRRVTHIDFMELTKGHTITLDIPIKLVGESAGVLNGGIMDFLMHTISITCLPSQIVSELEVDISKLVIGDTLRVADLPLKGLQANSDANITILHITPPIKEAAKAEVATEEVEEAADTAKAEESAE